MINQQPTPALSSDLPARDHALTMGKDERTADSAMRCFYQR